MGEDTELPDVISLAKTNLALITVFFTTNLVAMLISNQHVIIAAILLRMLFPLFSLALIYKCFHKICAPDDINVPIRPSRFKFVNDMRAKQEQKAEETRSTRENLLRKEKESKSSSSPINKSKKKK